MGKITWTDRTNGGANAKISASIFNDTKGAVNTLYDVVKAQLGTTSSVSDASLTISGTINISGSIIPNTNGADTTSSFDLGSPTAAWGEIYVATSSLNFVSSDGAITKWSQDDVAKLKKGEPIATDKDKALVSQRDTGSFIRTSARGRMTHYVGNNVAIDLI